MQNYNCLLLVFQLLVIVPELQMHQIDFRQLYNEFARNIDWPVASAVAIVLLLLLVLPMAIYQHYQAKAAEVK